MHEDSNTLLVDTDPWDVTSDMQDLSAACSFQN